MEKKNRIRVQIGIEAEHFINVMRMIQDMMEKYPYLKINIEEGQYLDDR